MPVLLRTIWHIHEPYHRRSICRHKFNYCGKPIGIFGWWEGCDVVFSDSEWKIMNHMLKNSWIMNKFAVIREMNAQLSMIWLKTRRIHSTALANEKPTRYVSAFLSSDGHSRSLLLLLGGNVNPSIISLMCKISETYVISNETNWSQKIAGIFNIIFFLHTQVPTAARWFHSVKSSTRCVLTPRQGYTSRSI